MDKEIQLHVDSAAPVEGDHEEESRSGRNLRGLRTEKKAAVSMEGVASPSEDHDDLGVEASVFDYSAENHLRATGEIAKLCGEPEGDAAFEKADIDRLSSKITFLREWRHFNYKPRSVRFACETQKQNIANEMNLPQFSSATVPKDIAPGEKSSGSSKDFVLHVGGSIWALDWCPRVHPFSDQHINCEFLAVAAHPPESSYHKIGTPLTGRGMIQIWCLLSVAAKEAEVLLSAKRKGISGSFSNAGGQETQPKRPRGRPRKIVTDTQPKRPIGRPRKIVTDTQPKRPRGRPKKKPISENDMESEQQLVEALAIEYPKDSSKLHDEVPLKTVECSTKNHVTENQKDLCDQVSAGNSSNATSSKSAVKNKTKVLSSRDGTSIPLLTPSREPEASSVNSGSNHSCEQDLPASVQTVPDNLSMGLDLTEDPIPKHLALPRVVLCLAHNGKVAWDIKWRPCNVNSSEQKPWMGYLAVLLGNGSMEVWEVPSPHIMKLLYFPHSEGMDPRFVKLEPVFRCSKLKCGDRQSIPLTLEWSASVPHDHLLAGCHDGTVALWKFSASDSSKDTRPLLCFSAATASIRTLAWAPVEKDSESANVIITAGQEGLKFWDIRDPFRPLWNLNTVDKAIYSLDWLPNPRCVILSYGDGTLRILSMAKAALDVPVTGKPFNGTAQQGLHRYNCSSYCIWSVQASRTGKVAYCSADGTALTFQLTTRAVEKDPFRNRAPHFLCGSITTEDESALTVNTPLPDTPVSMKTPKNESGNVPERANELQGEGHQPEDQILRLCYGEEAEMEFEPGDASPSPTGKNNLKPRNRGSRKEAKRDRALVGRDDGPEAMEEKGEAWNEVKVLPPKIAAMHRVRWNKNKGSERWLCFGGAAGILRCQEISLG